MTAYTMYVNKKFDRAGHIFQGRYKSIIVEKESYLFQVHRYIHLNPVKAGLVQTPQIYPWSSYQDYLSQRKDMPVLDVAEILGMFSENPDNQKKLLQEFTAEATKEEFDPFQKQTRGILGSQKFMLKLTKVLRGVRP